MVLPPNDAWGIVICCLPFVLIVSMLWRPLGRGSFALAFVLLGAGWGARWLLLDGPLVSAWLGKLILFLATLALVWTEPLAHPHTRWKLPRLAGLACAVCAYALALSGMAGGLAEWPACAAGPSVVLAGACIALLMLYGVLVLPRTPVGVALMLFVTLPLLGTAVSWPWECVYHGNTRLGMETRRAFEAGSGSAPAALVSIVAPRHGEDVARAGWGWALVAHRAQAQRVELRYLPRSLGNSMTGAMGEAYALTWLPRSARVIWPPSRARVLDGPLGLR